MGIFYFKNLTESIREKMLSEIETDISNGKLYLSNRLNKAGNELYPILLKESVINGNAETLKGAIQENACLASQELRKGQLVKVPSNAAELLSQNEFNRYYIRGVCMQAMEEGKEDVEVYRGRESSWSRSQSETMIGEKINAWGLLEDLRNSIGKAPSMLPEINSGLSVMI